MSFQYYILPLQPFAAGKKATPNLYRKNSETGKFEMLTLSDFKWWDGCMQFDDNLIPITKEEAAKLYPGVEL